MTERSDITTVFSACIKIETTDQVWISNCPPDFDPQRAPREWVKPNMKK